jgi:hypothetical protein
MLEPPFANGLADSALARELERVVGQAMGEALRDAASAPDDELPPLRVPPAAAPSAPDLLARVHPGGTQSRRSARVLYGRCLAHYRVRIQQPLRPGCRDDDLGLAAACFVVANLAAVDQTHPDPACIAPVERQMRHLIAATRSWADTPTTQRQSVFEQLALLAVLINETRLQARSQGAAAVENVRRAASGYLRQLLGLDPRQLVLTPSGLVAAATRH